MRMCTDCGEEFYDEEEVEGDECPSCGGVLTDFDEEDGDPVCV